MNFCGGLILKKSRSAVVYCHKVGFSVAVFAALDPTPRAQGRQEPQIYVMVWGWGLKIQIEGSGSRTHGSCKAQATEAFVGTPIWTLCAQDHEKISPCQLCSRCAVPEIS